MEKLRVAMTMVLLCFLLPGGSQEVGQVADEGDTTVEWPRQNPEIQLLHIRTDIYLRFATTYVTSHVVNTADVSKEAVFTVRIPKVAFMTNFSMQTEERIHYGKIKEVHEAKEDYARYKSKVHGGNGGGKKNGQKLRGFNTFRVAVNVAPKEDIHFNLTYQQLLHRRLGAYRHVIYLSPGQVVRDLKVDVHVSESRPIRTIKVPPLMTTSTTPDGNADNQLAHVQRESESVARISYHPSVRHQLQTSPQGIAGQFVIEYDVSRDQRSEELYVSRDYFVQYFAPVVARPLPKNIIFLLDVSRSMSGVKMEQAKVAMTTVLEELRADDKFNIITFSTVMRFWKNEGLHEPTSENLQNAREFIGRMTASRGTNVNDALLRGIAILKDADQKQGGGEERVSLIMVLIDGEPTAGIVSSDRILTNVRQANNGTSSLYCLGMDKGVDFTFLQKLALQNNGAARLIYEDSDTALEFHELYREIEKPLLSSLTFKYPPGDKIVPTSLSSTYFHNYFQGSEMVVTGMLNDGVTDVTASTEAVSVTGRFRTTERETVSSSASSRANVLERIWAFLTIQRLLDEEMTGDSLVSSTAITRALELSLRYSFVTSLTTMVIVKPEQPHTNVGRLKEDHKNRGRNGARSAARRHNPTFVDNDPHFIISVKGIPEGICFDVDGEPGDIYQLIYDKMTGIIVNGYVVSKDIDDSHEHNTTQHRRTYFGELSILHPGGSISISPHFIKINNRKVRWKKSQILTIGGSTINVRAKKNVTVKLRNGIVFGVLRHKVHKPHPSKVDFLGFYVQDGSRLSKHTHGLIGQFQHQTCQILEAPHPKKNGQVFASLLLQGPHIKSHDVQVKLSRRRNMELQQHVACWHVGNNGEELLQGTYLNYKVPSLTYRHFSMTLNSLDLLSLS